MWLEEIREINSLKRAFEARLWWWYLCEVLLSLIWPDRRRRGKWTFLSYPPVCFIEFRRNYSFGGLAQDDKRERFFIDTFRCHFLVFSINMLRKRSNSYRNMLNQNKMTCGMKGEGQSFSSNKKLSIKLSCTWYMDCLESEIDLYHFLYTTTHDPGTDTIAYSRNIIIHSVLWDSFRWLSRAPRRYNDYRNVQPTELVCISTCAGRKKWWNCL